MWLINVETLGLEHFVGKNTPKYAILSHTWEDEEISFQEMNQYGPYITYYQHTMPKGFAKIRQTCCLAALRGLQYAWVDTCCIDKSSSAELTEAINSMFRWYRDAEVCYAYLSDFDDSLPNEATTLDRLAKCRWFFRGWTLQELIAPTSIRFYSRSWIHIGTKLDLCFSIHSITSIPTDLLLGRSRSFEYSIARRMSWAARRKTTRIEDTAYCLLGLFAVNMPLLYGEGDKAFLRLQEELVKSTTDASLFAWTTKDSSLPPHPDPFGLGLLSISLPAHHRSTSSSRRNPSPGHSARPGLPCLQL
ncbi:HET-domain-containing protein [Podospora conica]|nr:HET-domain-containing protein [Schizothecium conicum]